MRAKATVVIEDVYVDEAYADHRDIASRAGFSAVTSTPIIESGNALGVLSGHFQKPHKPHRAEILSLEDCARDTGSCFNGRLDSHLVGRARTVRLWRSCGESGV
jgi:GAF domain-containing protein